MSRNLTNRLSYFRWRVHSALRLSAAEGLNSYR